MNSLALKSKLVDLCCLIDQVINKLKPVRASLPTLAVSSGKRAPRAFHLGPNRGNPGLQLQLSYMVLGPV